jgi:hypothetical protein
MTTIRLVEWKPGLRKISLTKLLQRQLGVSLSVAKHAVDELLEGRQVSLTVPGHVDGASLAAEIQLLGAVCEVHDG